MSILFDRHEPFSGAAKYPPLIGIMGKAGAGKDTVRLFLENYYKYKGYAFADPMRDMMQALFKSCGIPDKYRLERDFKEVTIPKVDVSYRQMMQALGTEWGRCLSQNIWINLTSAKIDNDIFHRHCISDVRFRNEADWIKANGGQLWLIQRPGIAAVNAHISEQEMDGIEPDVTFVNSGTINDLEDVVEQHLEKS